MTPFTIEEIEETLQALPPVTVVALVDALVQYAPHLDLKVVSVEYHLHMSQPPYEQTFGSFFCLLNEKYWKDGGGFLGEAEMKRSTLHMEAELDEYFLGSIFENNRQVLIVNKEDLMSSPIYAFLPSKRQGKPLDLGLKEGAEEHWIENFKTLLEKQHFEHHLPGSEKQRSSGRL